MADKQDPFVRVREVISSVPWGGWIKSDMPLQLRHRYFMPFWSGARLRRHLEMLKAFGYNSVQISANPVIAWWVGADAEGWRQRQLFRCRVAHELGMSVSAFVWGAAVPDAAKGGQQFSELDWHKPEDRARLLAWYRDQAEFAPYIDRVVTHWVDPGYSSHSCKECTIDAVVEMHNTILSIYRERNPEIRGALSTWFMRKDCWPGFEGAEKLAAHPELDRETDIVFGGSFQGDLKVFAKQGRRAAVWGWYTADDEIQPALWVRMSVLEGHFPHNLSPGRREELAPQWTEGLAFYSLDDCFQGLNMQNLYVAGRLMQDPSLDAQELLDEFVRGFVGYANAPAVAAALRAVERARTLSGTYNSKVMDAVEPPSELKIAGVAMTTSWLDNTALIVDAALGGMKTVKVAPDFRTAWPVTMEPAEYLTELQAHLEAIRQMLAFMKGVRLVERLKAGGATREELTAAVAALAPVLYDPAHTAGLEASIYSRKLADLKQGLGIK